MVRYTLRLRTQPLSPYTAMVVDENRVDIAAYDQLEEIYLTRVNSKGQVPVLTGAELAAPMPESLDITFYACDRYPNLAPHEHADVIRSLLKELHEINFFSVSTRPENNRAQNITAAIEERLAVEGISNEYREALLFKLNFHKKTMVPALAEDVIKDAEKRTTKFFEKISKLRSRYASKGSPWIFGDAPTALDAHAVVFVARLLDVEHRDLIPDDSFASANEAMRLPAWQDTMEGRRTLPPFVMKSIRSS